MKERRRFLRYAIQKRAKVHFSRDRPPLECTVFDLTSHGAGLQLALNLYAPKWFELSFDNFRSARQCQLVWQQNDRLGVSFSAPGAEARSLIEADLKAL
jgi:PilZ domain